MHGGLSWVAIRCYCFTFLAQDVRQNCRRDSSYCFLYTCPYYSKSLEIFLELKLRFSVAWWCLMRGLYAHGEEVLSSTCTKTKLQIFQVEEKKLEFTEAEHLNTSKHLHFSFESHSKWSLYEIFITSTAVCRYSNAAGIAD